MAVRQYCPECGRKISEFTCGYQHSTWQVRRSCLIDTIEGSGAIQTGEFVLSSGMSSNRYFDLSRIMGNPEILFILAKEFHEIYQETNAQAVGGPATGAIPIATALSLYSYQRPFAWRDRIPAFNTRFPHSMLFASRYHLEGQLARDQRVLLVDDVFTTGESFFMCARFLEREYGATIVGCAAILDRKMGGERWLKEQGYQVKSLLSIDDLIREG